MKRRAKAEQRIAELVRQQLGVSAPLLELGEIAQLRPGEAAAICCRSPVAAAPSDPGLPEVARALQDGGRFVVQLRLGEGRWAPWRWSWHELQATFARSGLWIEAHLLLRELPLSSAAVRLRPGSLLPLAGRVVVAGSRLGREVVARRDQALRQLAGEGRTAVVVAGRSMSPTFDIGDRVTVVPCPRPASGDIVMLQGKTGFVIHRVIAALGGRRLGWIVHRGDRPTAMPMVAPRWRVVGRLLPANS